MTENEMIEWMEAFKKTYAGFPKESEEACDAVISALKKNKQYREMDRKLRAVYGDCDGLLATAVEGLCKHPGVNIGKPIKARLLVDEDVDKWDAYREIGTVEECREAAENQKAKNPSVHKQQYSDAYNCSKCGWTFIHKNETGWFCGQHYKFCPNCGQAIRWSENLEGRE